MFIIHTQYSAFDGTAIETDWCQRFAEGAVDITPINEEVAAEGTDAKVKEVEDAIKDGSLHVFDTSTFTVNGSSLEDLIRRRRRLCKMMQIMFQTDTIMSLNMVLHHHFDIIIDGITSVTD